MASLLEIGTRPRESAADAQPHSEVAMAESTPSGCSELAVQVWKRLDYRTILPDVMLYSGAIPRRDGVSLQSRHIEHPHNRLAVEQALEDLERVGRGLIKVRAVEFQYGQQTLLNVEGEIRGDDDQLLFVTAHLDSTPENDAKDRDGKTAPAPGADDNASGVAGVLAIAEIFASSIAAGLFRPRHTIRFVLFNAEEHDLIGSHIYAGELQNQQSRVLGAFQMDMIGFSKKPPPRSWELHFGFEWDPAVQRRSQPLAEAVLLHQAHHAPDLEPPILFSDQDPADHHSDHSSFQGCGFPALVACEGERNLDRDTSHDTFVNPHYAADIARVIGATVWTLAMD